MTVILPSWLRMFPEVNNLLCESNSEGMFITAFEGVLDLVTGEFCFVNAGHEIPFLCKKGKTFEPYKIKAGFVLAVMEGIRYQCGSIQLEVGDRIFQYTDGVTEATNKNNEPYGLRSISSGRFIRLSRCTITNLSDSADRRPQYPGAERWK